MASSCHGEYNMHLAPAAGRRPRTLAAHTQAAARRSKFEEA
jgi:hypothetical protein